MSDAILAGAPTKTYYKSWDCSICNRKGLLKWQDRCPNCNALRCDTPLQNTHKWFPFKPGASLKYIRLHPIGCGCTRCPQEKGSTIVTAKSVEVFGDKGDVDEPRKFITIPEYEKRVEKLVFIVTIKIKDGVRVSLWPWRTEKMYKSLLEDKQNGQDIPDIERITLLHIQMK